MDHVIGRNIRLLREGMNFNQSAVAKFLKVDQSLISKIEKGERNLSADMLEKLACLFGVKVSDIENGTIPPSGLSVAFRAGELTVEDMEAICAVNRIALNSEYMAELLKRDEV